MATATTKPVKGAGKQKTSARTASGAADNTTPADAPTTFTKVPRAAQELWLGEAESIGELENLAGTCESSTAEAIAAAEPERKRSVFYRGFDELRETLCAETSRYYNTCLEIARRKLDAGSAAESAKAATARDLSTFLRVTTLDGNRRAKAIASNGRVREFVRNVCLNYPDFQVLDRGQRAASLLPRWPWGRSVGAMIGRGPGTRAGDKSSALTRRETERLILGAEETLIKDLRRAIAKVHRIALVRKPRGKHGGRTPKTLTAFRRAVVYKAASTGLTGVAYARHLSLELTPAVGLQRRSLCPDNYVAAYTHPNRRFREAIMNEKSKATRYYLTKAGWDGKDSPTRGHIAAARHFALADIDRLGPLVDRKRQHGTSR